MQKINSTVLVVTALIFYAISIYCFMWAMSSFSLSFTECSGVHGVFHEVQRCRWAAVAGYGFWGFGIAGFLLLGVAIYRRVKNNEKNT